MVVNHALINQAGMQSFTHGAFENSLRCVKICVKGDLHGTTLSHATSLRQAYDTNCFV